jgi:hypothetical protein
MPVIASPGESTYRFDTDPIKVCEGASGLGAVSDPAAPSDRTSPLRISDAAEQFAQITETFGQLAGAGSGDPRPARVTRAHRVSHLSERAHGGMPDMSFRGLALL